MIALRDARPGEIDTLVALVLRAIATYAEWRGPAWVPPDPVHHATHWRRQFEARMVDPAARTIVAVDEAGASAGPVGVVGFTQARESANTGPPIPGMGHVWALFVDPPCWRRGMAGRLLDDAEAALRAGGFVDVVLSTPLGSPACAFYEARGYRPNDRRGWFAPASLEVAGYTKAL